MYYGNPILLLLLIPASICLGQEKSLNLSDVVVTAGRTETALNSLNRDIELIMAEQFKAIRPLSLDEMLKNTAGLDLRSRGPLGVQSDLSLRGGSSDEALLMIDGIKQIDPQTSHHNLNIPLTSNSIERIEILRGGASSSFGPDALSGVVNIITKDPLNSSLNINIKGGANGLYGTEIYAASPVLGLGNSFSFGSLKSDGYMHNTDFNNKSMSLKSSLPLGQSKISLLLGLQEKYFGANSFYSPLYPNQRENTFTKNANLKGDFHFNETQINASAFLRTNKDVYLLDDNRPDWYRNVHRSTSYGFETQGSHRFEWLSLSLGAEYSDDRLESSNLGNHRRNKKGTFAEAGFSPVEGFNFNLGAFLYDYGSEGWRLYPGADMGYNLMEGLRAFASYGRAFRIPCFTELFYNSPASMGNPALKNENSDNYEAGIKLIREEVKGRLSCFYRDGKNIIDWGRESGTEPWQAANIERLRTAGINADISLHPSGSIGKLAESLSIDYCYINCSRLDSKMQFRDRMQNLRHQLKAAIEFQRVLGISQDLRLSWQDRINFQQSLLLDYSASRDLGAASITVKIENLLNRYLCDFTGLRLPGRWVTGTIGYAIN